MFFLFKKQIKEAGQLRQNILDTEHDLYKANYICGALVKSAVKERKAAIKSLRDLWGKFFYDNPR